MSEMSEMYNLNIKLNQQIEIHRKSEFEIQFFLPNGQPIQNADVELKLKHHHFLFGTAVTGNPADPKDQWYFDFIQQNFNAVVDENGMKWYSVEKEKNKINHTHADQLVSWASKQNIAIRGHCLFWDREKFVQPWINDLSNEELKARMETHIVRMCERYRGTVICWDVNNEMLDGGYYSKRLGDDIRVWMFKRAHELDPQATLFVNEFSILGNTEKTERFIQLIKTLQDAGAPVTGIGIQEHSVERLAIGRSASTGEIIEIERQHHAPLTYEEMIKTLDRLGELNLPIHLTEISVKTPCLQERADKLEAFYRIAYSHPAVKALLVWGFWGKRHWLGSDAALVEGKDKILPAGKQISNLIKNEWCTQVVTKTDLSGRIKFTGHYGIYEGNIVVQNQNECAKIRVELLPNATVIKSFIE